MTSDASRDAFFPSERRDATDHEGCSRSWAMSLPSWPKELLDAFCAETENGRVAVRAQVRVCRDTAGIGRISEAIIK